MKGIILILLKIIKIGVSEGALQRSDKAKAVERNTEKTLDNFRGGE